MSSEVEKFGYQESFKRVLGMKEIIIFGMVFMSAAAAVVLFGFNTAFSENHSFLASLGAYFAVLFTALSYGRMSERIPLTGSTYTFVHRAIDPRLGFIAGWTLTLGYILMPMFLFQICSNYANALFPSIPYWAWVLIFSVFATYVNYRGIEAVANFNSIITYILIAGLIIFFGYAIHYFAADPSAGSWLSMKAIYDPATFNISAVSAALVIGSTAYLGFDAMTTLREESNLKPGQITKAIVYACSIQTVIFLFTCYFGTLFLPDYTQIPDLNTAYFHVFGVAGGPILQAALTIITIVAIGAVAIPSQAGVSRLLFGMGRDRLLPPKFFTYQDPKTGQPLYTILMVAVISTIGALVIPEAWIAEVLAFGWLIGYMLVNLSVIRYCWFKQGEHHFFMNMLFPLISFFFTLYIVYSCSAFALELGFTWMAVGISYLIIRCMISSDFKNQLEKITISD